MYESVAYHPQEFNLFWFAVLYPYGRKQSFLIYNVFLLSFIFFFPFSVSERKNFSVFPVVGRGGFMFLSRWATWRTLWQQQPFPFYIKGKELIAVVLIQHKKRECSIRKSRSSLVVQIQWEMEIRGHCHKHGLGVPAASEIAWTSREGVCKLQILAYLPSP